MTIAALRSLARRPLLGLPLLRGVPGRTAAQGIVSGRVTDQANGNPLVGARVIVVGTSLTASSNAEGRYRITGVPAGTFQVRASQIGFASGTKPATVADQGAVM